MGCVPSSFADVHELQAQIRRLQQQLNNAAGGGGGAAYAPPAVVNAHGGGGGGGGGFCEVLFFPDPALPCRNFLTSGGCRRQNCTYSHAQTSLTRFLAFLNSARQSLDIAIFNLTCDEIAQAVLAAHKRGVRVRIVTDDEQASSTGSDIAELQRAGVAVVTDRSAGAGKLLHHKFCVLDNRLVANGSFNWTRQAVLGNEENVVIADAPAMVRAFAQRFEQLWRKFGGR